MFRPLAALLLAASVMCRAAALGGSVSPRKTGGESQFKAGVHHHLQRPGARSMSPLMAFAPTLAFGKSLNIRGDALLSASSSMSPRHGRYPLICMEEKGAEKRENTKRRMLRIGNLATTMPFFIACMHSF